MINPEDSVQYDFRDGCTEEESVAKLLGWMRGTKRLQNLNLSDDGAIDINQLPAMWQLPCPLDKFISEERELASTMFVNAATKGAFDEAQKWEERVAYWENIAEKVGRYKLAIQRDLSHSNPILKIHAALTAETGIQHITLLSLDRWARIQLEVSVLDEESESVAGKQFDEPSGLAETTGERTKQKRFDALRPEIEEILKGMKEPTPGKVMAELRMKVGSENTCVLRNRGDGIEWENDKGVTKMLTISALRERINTWKKHRLIKG